MTDRVVIASDRLTAEVAPLGAELQSLRDGEGRELMSDGDPAFWSGRAPLLFPIVGRLNGDTYRVDGRDHAMPKHGFARRSPFELVEQGETRVRFRLTDSAGTRDAYPFAFALDMAFALDGGTLWMTATIANRGDGVMPASFGFHPAFAWPLPYGDARGDHRIVFAEDEPAELCAITPDGLIAPGPRRTPVKGKVLTLADDLFASDALVWRDLRSRSLTYGGDGAVLRIAFPDTPWLGIWTKPGARFVCVEPWAGMADPEGFAGDFTAKPGVFALAAGDSRAFRMIVTLER